MVKNIILAYAHLVIKGIRVVVIEALMRLSLIK